MKLTRRLRIARCLFSTTAELTAPEVAQRLGEADSNGVVSAQLRRMVDIGLAQYNGKQRRHYSLTSKGIDDLLAIESGKWSAFSGTRGKARASSTPRISPPEAPNVIKSVARNGQAPKGAISSVFDLGGRP